VGDAHSTAASGSTHEYDQNCYSTSPYLLSGQITLAVNDPDNLLGIVIEHMPLGLLEHYCPVIRVVDCEGDLPGKQKVNKPSLRLKTLAGGALDVIFDDVGDTGKYGNGYGEVE
jgi:hypothetical protein